MLHNVNMNEQDIIHILNSILDPELGISITELGLIRKIEVSDTELSITMTLTSPMCPFADIIISDIKDACILAGAPEPTIHISFDPPWEVPEKIRLMWGI